LIVVSLLFVACNSHTAKCVPRLRERDKKVRRSSPFIRLSAPRFDRILIYMRPPRMDAAQLTLVREHSDHPDFLFELKNDQ
jgi:hypothetical protein